MFDTFNGLPAHVILVHAVVVLVPLACAALVLHAFWPTARRRLGIVTPALAGVSLVLVPITTSAGEYLRDHLFPKGQVPGNVQHHNDLGDQLLFYVLPLFVLAVVVWLLGRAQDGTPVMGVAAGRTLPAWLSPAIGFASTALAAATIVQLYRIGDSGAQTVWGGVLH
jgi:hypothetical protein